MAPILIIIVNSWLQENRKPMEALIANRSDSISIFKEKLSFFVKLSIIKSCSGHLPNITQTIIVFSFGLEMKQSTTLGHGHLEHLNNSGIQNLKT